MSCMYVFPPGWRTDDLNVRVCQPCFIFHDVFGSLCSSSKHEDDMEQFLFLFSPIFKKDARAFSAVDKIEERVLELKS